MNFVVNAGAPETDSSFVITVPLFLHSLELVITSIYYNPAMTLAILDRHDWTQQFFSLWFKHLHNFSRVHDRKLGIAAICALFEWLAGVGDAPLAHNSSQLLGGALKLFKGLPEAIVGASLRVIVGSRWSELTRVLQNGRSTSRRSRSQKTRRTRRTTSTTLRMRTTALVRFPFTFHYIGFAKPIRCTAEGDVHDATNEYLEMLARRETEQSDDDDDDDISTWSEEVTWISPLDSIDVYDRFSSTLRGALADSRPPGPSANLASNSARVQCACSVRIGDSAAVGHRSGRARGCCASRNGWWGEARRGGAEGADRTSRVVGRDAARPAGCWNVVIHCPLFASHVLKLIRARKLERSKLANIAIQVDDDVVEDGKAIDQQHEDRVAEILAREHPERQAVTRAPKQASGNKRVSGAMVVSGSGEAKRGARRPGHRRDGKETTLNFRAHRNSLG